MIPHRLAGLYIAQSREDNLVTINLTPGSNVYGEKVIKANDVEYRSVFVLGADVMYM